MKANVNASKIASGLLDSPDRTTRLFASYKKLSPKEKEIFGLLAQGFSVSEIARKLGKSIKTVENQRTAVYEKMELHGIRDLAEGARILGYY
nr:helix-turn-helix transcriptional regulator [uncultured Treponema sp.]